MHKSSNKHLGAKYYKKMKKKSLRLPGGDSV